MVKRKLIGVMKDLQREHRITQLQVAREVRRKKVYEQKRKRVNLDEWLDLMGVHPRLGMKKCINGQG